MTESAEVQAARLDERLKSIQGMLQQNQVSNKELHTKVEQMYVILMNIDSRVKVLEEQVSEQSHMYEEFQQLKHEVSGARRVVRWIWFTISGLIAFGVSVKTELFSLFTK